MIFVVSESRLNHVSQSKTDKIFLKNAKFLQIVSTLTEIFFLPKIQKTGKYGKCQRRYGYIIQVSQVDLVLNKSIQLVCLVKCVPFRQAKILFFILIQ
jgi:hypothetical protein